MENSNNAVQQDDQAKRLKGELAAAHRTIAMLLDQAESVPANDAEDVTGGLSSLHRQIATSYIAPIAKKYGDRIPAAYIEDHLTKALNELLDAIYPQPE